ncbi:MAG: threonine synthase [Rhodospirillaceae bacterium]|nr:threonine synthase [Rhodospirillaceae bacterium]
MRYQSTRGRAPELGFDDVLLAGLADDGGLYVPSTWPTFSAAEWADGARLDYAALAARVIAPYVRGSVIERDIAAITRQAFASFSHKAIAPLVQLDTNLWLLELFHGPTLAFKDYALQLVGLLFDRVLKARGSRITVVGATSGDTGSAAIEACKDRDAVDIFIMHPAGRVSDVQRRQMTTVQSANVHNIAIAGTFDDCQNLVKEMFADERMRTELNLSAVNSINWARIMGQVVYYAWAALRLGAPQRQVAFSVPTGNFGNVFAGYVAKQMGLPIVKFVVGSNRNDILTRYFETRSMTATAVAPSLSPSMDIQISSNFERLLFDAYGRDGKAVSGMMDRFKQSGQYAVDAKVHERILAMFSGARLDDEGTKKVIGEIHTATGQIVDPHTAVGIHAARGVQLAPGTPMIAMATAHPAKFPDAVHAAIGLRPALPAHMAGLFDKTERFTQLPNDLDQVKRFVRERARRI